MSSGPITNSYLRLDVDKYTLDANHQPRLEQDVNKWLEWFKTANRRVAVDEVKDWLVSTIFLAVNNHYANPPQLFETFVIGGPLNGEMLHYETWEQAVRGHKEMVHRLEAVAVSPSKTW
jgi:hypothetical protein